MHLPRMTALILGLSLPLAASAEWSGELGVEGRYFGQTPEHGSQFEERLFAPRQFPERPGGFRRQDFPPRACGSESACSDQDGRQNAQRPPPRSHASGHHLGGGQRLPLSRSP